MNISRKINAVLTAAAVLASCGVFAEEDAPLILDETDNVPTRDEAVAATALEVASTGRNPYGRVSVEAGLSVLETLNAVAHMMEPEHSIRLDRLTEEEETLIRTTTNRFSTGDIKMEWTKVLDNILAPFDIAFFEDGEQVAFGSREAMEELATKQATDALANNHNRIEVDFSGGVDIGVALRTIRSLAEIKMNFDYMEDDYRDIVAVSEPEAETPEADKPAVAVPQKQKPKKQTTFSTDKQKVEWRTVMREVLEPISYRFVEERGVVRPMPKASYEKYLQDRINAKPLVTKIVRLRHADPESLAKQLNELHITKHGSAYIKVAQPKKDKTKTYSGGSAGMSIPSGTKVGASSVGSGNFGNLERPSTPPSLIIADVEENIPVLEERIAQLDVRERQILIEALVLDLNDDTARELGVHWTGLNKITAGASWQKARMDNSERVHINNYKSATSANSKTTRGSDGTSRTWKNESSASFNENAWDDGTYALEGGSEAIPGGGLVAKVGSGLSQVSERVSKTLFSGIVGPINLTAVMNFIQTSSKSKVLSSPVIVMGDHTESIIQVGQADPIATVSSTYVADRADLAQEVDWQIVMTGVTLWVAPEITDDGKSVRLSVHPQITDANPKAGATVTIDGTTLTYPQVTVRELDTRVTVPSGSTLVLGGLIKTEDSVSKEKVWLLGDIPLLGRLFRWESIKKDPRNLMILVRPTILDDENPETKFEKPAMRTIEPMLDLAIDQLGGTEEPERDPMREAEQSVIRLLKRDKDGKETEVAEAEAATDGEAVGTADTAAADGAADATSEAPAEEAPVIVE